MSGTTLSATVQSSLLSKLRKRAWRQRAWASYYARPPCPSAKIQQGCQKCISYSSMAGDSVGLPICLWGRGALVKDGMWPGAHVTRDGLVSAHTDVSPRAPAHPSAGSPRQAGSGAASSNTYLCPLSISPALTSHILPHVTPQTPTTHLEHIPFYYLSSPVSSL